MKWYLTKEGYQNFHKKIQKLEKAACLKRLLEIKKVMFNNPLFLYYLEKEIEEIKLS